jgi:hypothetical protein
VNDLDKVRLSGGPHDGRIIEEARDAGIVVVMTRWPDDGPAQHDKYRLTRGVMGDGAREALFIGSEDAPQPAEWDDDEPEPSGPNPIQFAAKAFLDGIDYPSTMRIIGTRANLGGWVGARSAGCWDVKVCDAIVKAALDAVWELIRSWAAEDEPAADPLAELKKHAEETT